jgi:hypothetical protein
VDPSGRQVLNLLRPLGSPLPSVAALETFQRTLQTGEPQVSDLEIGPAAGRWVISVTLPLLRAGKVHHILVAVMTPESFASVLAAADVAGATIVDRKGVVVATTEGPEQRVGTPASAGFVSRAREQDEAVFTGGPTHDGATAYTAFSRAKWSRFTVGIAVPRESLEGPLRRSLWLLSAAAVGALVLSLGLTHLAGRRFAGRLGQLTAAFSAFGRGETVPELPDFTLSELSGVKARSATRWRSCRRAPRRWRNRSGATARCSSATRPACPSPSRTGASWTATRRSPGSSASRTRPPCWGRTSTRSTPSRRSATSSSSGSRRRAPRSTWSCRCAGATAGSSGCWRAWSAARVHPAPTSRPPWSTEQKAADELRSIARLANAAAHEINNPLTMILGRLAMLRDDLTLKAETRERAVQMIAAGERIREIVVDMNRLTRVQLFEHTGRGLPEMIDIRKSAADPGGAGAPPAASPPPDSLGHDR